MVAIKEDGWMSLDGLCAVCGRGGIDTGGISYNDDSWFTLGVPFLLGNELGDYGYHICSIWCLKRFVERIQPTYEDLEPSLAESRDTSARESL